MAAHKLRFFQKSRFLFLVFFILFLVASVSLLIFTTYQSHCKLQESYVRLWKEQMQSRVQSLDAFLVGKQQDVRRLASSSQVLGYYQARDLGMTMRYGLLASLSQVGELFLERQSQTRLEGDAVFSRFVLVDDQGDILVDTGVESRTGFALKPPEPGQDMRPLLQGSSGSIQLQDLHTGTQSLVLRADVHFKQARKGSVLGWIPVGLIQKSFCVSSGLTEFEFIRLALKNHYLQASTCRLTESLPSLDFFEPGRAERFEGLNLAAASGSRNGPTETGRTGPLVAMRLDLSRIPASMVWFKPLEDVFGKAAPGQLLVIMGVFLAIVLAGCVYIVWSTARHAALQQHLQQAQKMEAVGNLAGGIAHDFNNLLQGLSSIVQLMQMRLSRDQKHASHLQRMEEIIFKAAQLVRGLLTFSRKHEPNLQPLNINEQITKTAEILERTIPKMIELQLNLDPEIKTIDADPVQLQQVIINLVNNARDAIPAQSSGIIAISTENVSVGKLDPKVHPNLRSREFVLVSVSDNGTGMDQETSQRLYEPFYSTKGVGKGTGLGLAMVYGIVKEHGGEIECRSQLKQGTVFRIFFPVTKELRTEPPRPVEPRRAAFQPLHVLVVDDEPAIADSLKDFLSSLGHTVERALSGEEALRAVQGNNGIFDAVILDLGMPGMGGEACLKQLREIAPDVKIIVGSGYGHHPLADDPARFGAQTFVPKPYSLQTIQDHLQLCQRKG